TRGRAGSPLCGGAISADCTIMPLSWYMLGKGELRGRNACRKEEVVSLTTGVSVTIPPLTAFQFRSDDAHALEFLIVTMPPWPAADEAETVDGKWPRLEILIAATNDGGLDVLEA